MLDLRMATSHDQPAIARLIAAVLQEYDDDICLAGAESDLLDIQANYFDRTGAFWVVAVHPATAGNADRDEIVGCHAAIAEPNQRDVCVFKRLYLAQPYRGTTWGKQLMQVAIDWARESGFKRIEFWSDSRFVRAHRFFARFGFQTTGQVRTMYDSHRPYEEYFFFLDLTDRKTDRSTA